MAGVPVHRRPVGTSNRRARQLLRRRLRRTRRSAEVHGASRNSWRPNWGRGLQRPCPCRLPSNRRRRGRRASTPTCAQAQQRWTRRRTIGVGGSAQAADRQAARPRPQPMKLLRHHSRSSRVPPESADAGARAAAWHRSHLRITDGCARRARERTDARREGEVKMRVSSERWVWSSVVSVRP